MRKVIIIGCPGSGKSTFGRKLAKMTNLPLYYLDMIYHRPDKTDLSKEEFAQKIEEITKEAEWIIDGCYFDSLYPRIKACDTIFFFDLATAVCLENVLKRAGKKREDFPWIEDEKDEAFHNYIRNFNANFRSRIIAMLNENIDKDIYYFTKLSQTDAFLADYPDNCATYRYFKTL